MENDALIEYYRLNRAKNQENVDALTIKMSSVKLKIKSTCTAGEEKKMWLQELWVLSETMKRMKTKKHILGTSYFNFYIILLKNLYTISKNGVSTSRRY